MDKVEQARRLAAVRANLEQADLAAFLVPRADEHQGEYVPASAERLAWVSGFTGSAGLAVVSAQEAVLFVDGRYTLQARAQADSAFWSHRHLTEDPVETWAAQAFSAGDRIGFDPWLHTVDGLLRLRTALERIGATLVAVENNLVDMAWTDRPQPPKSPAMAYPEAYAGEASAAKRLRIAAGMRSERVDATVISAPDSLAWLFNVRGDDVTRVPLVLGFAVLRDDGTAILFVDPEKIDESLKAALLKDGVSLLPPTEFGVALDMLGGKRVKLDRATAGVWIVERLRSVGAVPEIGDDPCALPKACKNATELAGMRAAHLRDGAAMVRFLHWLDQAVTDGALATGELTEWTVARHLDALRAEETLYRDLSFETISGTGPNAALPHYRVAEETARTLELGQIYLVDSGGQYLDGTTDVTRTVILGNPTEEMTRRYTQVLKGHVALSMVCFPEGTTGSQLDILARQFLWQDGVDYDHGTGHGVGCYLSVHEGPHRIAKVPNTIALRPGMVVSNEPGYYKSGAFGVRIENLVAVTAQIPQPQGAERSMLGFETLTLVPYDRRLIDLSLLTQAEVAWIDAYHARVRAALLPQLEAAAAAFLVEATASLSR